MIEINQHYVQSDPENTNSTCYDCCECNKFEQCLSDICSKETKAGQICYIAMCLLALALLVLAGVFVIYNAIEADKNKSSCNCCDKCNCTTQTVVNNIVSKLIKK